MVTSSRILDMSAAFNAVDVAVITPKMKMLGSFEFVCRLILKKKLHDRKDEPCQGAAVCEPC